MSPLIGQIAVQIIILLILADFSAAASAAGELNLAKLRERSEAGERGATRLLKLAEEPQETYDALQAAGTFLGLLASTILALFVAGRLSGAFPGLSPLWVQVITVLGIAVVLGYVTLVLAVVVPHRLGKYFPERTASVTFPLAHAAGMLFTPARAALSATAHGLLRLFRVTGPSGPENPTEEEIRMMLDESEEEGLIESGEGEMIDNVFEFNNTSIYDVMTHRVDVECIDVEESREVITETIRTTGYSRFPVYENKPDEILGLLYVKDFFLNQDTPVRDLLKEPIYVPDSMICDDLFHLMQREHTHFAVVTDEFGAFLGIVTMEDLLEEIVGNIYDEYDKKKDYIQPNPDGTWTISGRSELKDVEKALDIEIPEREEFTTLGGLVLSRTKEIPKDGQRFTVETDQLHIQVLRVAGRRVEETLVTVREKASES